VLPDVVCYERAGRARERSDFIAPKRAGNRWDVKIVSNRIVSVVFSFFLSLVFLRKKEKNRKKKKKKDLLNIQEI